MDIAYALDLILPAAQYGGSLTDNTREAFDALRWEDEREKPAWADLEAAWATRPDGRTLAQQLEGVFRLRMAAKQDALAALAASPEGAEWLLGLSAMKGTLTTALIEAEAAEAAGLTAMAQAILLAAKATVLSYPIPDGLDFAEDKAAFAAIFDRMTPSGKKAGPQP